MGIKGPVAGQDLVLGYDFGTSAVKAALLAQDGTIVAATTQAYPLMLPQRGWAEQDPRDWWRAMGAASRALTASVPDAAGRIAAIGLSAQMGGVVPVDAIGGALHNALIWLDTRSADIARELTGGMIRVAGYGPLKLARWLRLTGGAPSLSGKDAISKIVWLRRHRPDLWPRIHKFLDVKDYLLAQLTGRFVTSYDSAHLTWLFDARPGRKHWSPALLRQIDLDPARLPDIAGACDVAGGLSAQAATALGLRAGTPVTVGAGDVAAAAISAGNPAQGSLHLYLGTSLWLAARIARSRVDPATSIGSLSFADGSDYLLIATQENAGASIRWAMNLLGLAQDDFAGFEALARGHSPSADSPFFFPWLTGERVPVDDPRIRGAFANIAIESGRQALAFAVYEGVALNLRWAMASFDRLSGRAGQRLRLLGGGARSPFWAQMFADVLGREVEGVEAPDQCGTRGAAMTAAVAAGWYPDLAAAAAMTRPTAFVGPDPARAALHQARFRHYARYYPRLRKWHLPS
jgi:xylulokinase